MEIDAELLVNCLVNQHIYIQKSGKCCASYFIDGKLSRKSIEIIKKQELDELKITRNEIIKSFQELKQEIPDKEEKLNNSKVRLPLNFDDRGELMNDNNYHFLTGLSRDGFNDLCSYIPPFSLWHSDFRTPT